MSLAADQISFGFTAAAAGADRRASDVERYALMLEDCKVAYDLGYDVAWVLEHHFTDYYPTPSPLLVMSHLAAAFPGLSLGSSVIVAPWYQPLRLAEEISMVSNLCSGELHLSFGRGTAKLEYDAFDVDMSEARERYSECMEILSKALSGEKFAHHGEHFQIGREVVLRPTPKREKIHLYGAVGSEQSAPVNAEMGLPILCNSQFPPHVLARIVAAWRQRAEQLKLQTNGILPISANCLVGDSDEAAREEMRGYMATFFALQADHYEADANHWKDIEGYKQFSKSFGNLRKLADPANLDGFLDYQLVGTPDTICQRIETLAELGFNHFIVNCGKEGMPAEVRHDTYRRIAKEVAPAFR